ncbi:MAG: T9SS type A sorting domain-containing protein [Ignavibacteria bacterium]|jgi:photosystem II stability/assembly factor-like uncharacterized protein
MKKIILFLLFSYFFVSNLHAQWITQNSGTILTLFSVSAVDNDIVWACASGSNIFRTTDGGATWVNIGNNIPPPLGVETTIFAVDANTALFACYAGNPTITYVYKTTDAGASWNLFFTQLNGFMTGIWMQTPQQGFMVGWPTGGRWSLWKTTSGGSHWDSTGLFVPENNSSIWSYENSLVYMGTNIWFGARGKGIWHSTNDGSSWTLQDLTSGGFPYPSAIWFTDLNTGLSSANLNIVKTINGGTNWVAVGGQTGPEVVRGITGLGNEWWYVRDLDANIYYTSNGGTNWSIQFTSPSAVGFKHITKARNGNCLWAVNISGNIYKYIIPTGIKQISSEIPSSFKLYQNYPNPFNPETKIKFSIPDFPLAKGVRGMGVLLSVYDILGHEIITLVNEQLKPGTYEVQWDASRSASGVYFYRIEADNFIDSKKMLVIK